MFHQKCIQTFATHFLFRLVLDVQRFRNQKNRKCILRFFQGSSFVLSKDGAKLLVENVCKVPMVHLDDVFMGTNLHQLQKKPFIPYYSRCLIKLCRTGTYSQWRIRQAYIRWLRCLPLSVFKTLGQVLGISMAKLRNDIIDTWNYETFIVLLTGLSKFWVLDSSSHTILITSYYL